MGSTRFNLLMLNDNFLTDKKKLLSYLSNKERFSVMIANLKEAFAECKMKINPRDTSALNTCMNYQKVIDESSIDSLFKNKMDYFELYLYNKYNVDQTEYFFLKNGFEIDDSQIDILRKENKLNYIIAHRILENYDYFLLTKEPSKKLFFVGESMIYILSNDIYDKPELKNLNDYLVKHHFRPYLIIIDKDLYNSLREVKVGLEVEPYVKKSKWP